MSKATDPKAPMRSPSSLQLSAEDMRRLGHQIIEVIVEHFQNLPDKPVTGLAARGHLEQRLREPIPEKGTEVEKLLEQLQRDVFANIMHLDHPRFFAYVPGPSNFVSVMADALATGFNVFSGTWLEASGPTMIELITIDWLRQLFGFPETTGGLFVSGGSIANVTALAVAREVKLHEHSDRAVLYFSDQTHSSVKRAAKLLGFNPPQLRILPAGSRFRLALRDLELAVAKDREAGKIPFCVVANAGTTNTGAVDPLTELAVFCRKQDLWLHADAAYGGAAILCEEGRAWLAGIEQADSLTIDPHKWLFQPYEAGCLLVRDGDWLAKTFKVISDYGKDEELGEEEVNFCDRGIQLTRRFHALKFWLSLKTFGLEAFREAVARGMSLAKSAEMVLAKSSHCEITTPAQMGVVTFRYVGAEDLSFRILNAVNRRIVGKCIAEGFAMVSTTELQGKVVLRLCVINPQTTETDIEDTIRMIVRFGDQLIRE